MHANVGRPAMSRSKTVSLGVLVAAAASLHLVATAAGNAREQTLGLPDALTAKTSESSWTEHSITSSTLRIRVSIPSAWRVRTDNAAGGLSAVDIEGGRHLVIGEPTPAPMNIQQPLSDEQLRNSIATMQAAVPRGYVVEKAGQVRLGERLWVWWESAIPTFDLSTLGPYQEMLRGVPYRTGRSWSFAATPQQQTVRVYCTVLFPKDATSADIGRRTKEAGGVFAEIIRRLRSEAIGEAQATTK